MMNVVLVTVDSLRADHVGCYGYDRETTPNIDELATGGTFVDAYANANATRASFPSILTWTYPLAYGGFDYLSDARTMVSTPLQSAGYATGGFHSNVWLSRDFNYDRGFDTFYDSKSEPGMLARLRGFIKTNLDQDGVVYSVLQTIYDGAERQAGVDIGQTYKDAETTTDRAVDWVRKADPPFFLWVHYMDVHHPYIPRPAHAAAIEVDLDIGEREAIQLRRKMLEHPDEMTEDERQTLVNLYDSEIRYTDQEVGRLVGTVNQRFDQTTFLVTSDHGEEFADHGNFSHNPSMYDEILHVPLVLSGNGVDAEGYVGTDTQLLDVAPTVLDIASVDAPSTYQGRSVCDRVMSNEDAAVISETENDDGLRFAVRQDGWKYIWDQGEESRELYDLNEDPGERNSLEGIEEETSTELHAVLKEHVVELRQTNEELPEVQMDTETERRLKDLGYLQ
jgi:arylsulfatase A-like enzyme